MDHVAEQSEGFNTIGVINVDEAKVIQDDNGDYNLHVTATMTDTSNTPSSLEKEITIDIDGEKLGLTYLDHHHNSDGTVTINCSRKEPKKDLTSDTFEVSLPTIQVSYDRSQCIYGSDSAMSCILCSRLCPERIKDFKNMGVNMTFIPIEKDPNNG